MVEGCPHGEGVKVYSSGDKYIGSFKFGKREGFGKIQSPLHNGNVYEGQFKNGVRDGKGIYRWKNGKVYKGYWKNDKIEG